MHKAAEQAFTESVKQKVLNSTGVKDVTDLGGFESHILAGTHQGRAVILRATHTSHRDLNLVQAELEWLRWLHDQGAAVCEVLPLPGGELCVQVDEFIVSMLAKASGRVISEQDWGAPLFERWGQVVGQLHQLSRQYQAGSARRFCLTEDENLNFNTRVPVNQEQVQSVAAAEMTWLKGLDKDSSVYSLIHCDAHPGNFFVDGDADFTLFDFDDCCYGWYGYDVATILFGVVLQPWVDDTDTARLKMAETFVPAFLQGYAREADVVGLRMQDMARFLKLRELSLYGVFHTFFDVNNLTGWYAAKFMADRQRKIEQHQPYLDMDFSRFA